jgi:hypothetical protein
MSVRTLEAGGNRVDVLAETRLREIQDIVIPKESVDRTRRTGKRDPAKKDDPYRSQEQIVAEQAALRQKRRDDWRSLSGDKGQNFGSVQIDGTKKVEVVDPTPPRAEQATGWQRLDHWHRQAGKFEEWGRKNVESIGGDASVEMSPSSTDTRKRTKGTQRRRFQLAR